MIGLNGDVYLKRYHEKYGGGVGTKGLAHPPPAMCESKLGQTYVNWPLLTKQGMCGETNITNEAKKYALMLHTTDPRSRLRSRRWQRDRQVRHSPCNV